MHEIPSWISEKFLLLGVTLSASILSAFLIAFTLLWKPLRDKRLQKRKITAAQWKNEILFSTVCKITDVVAFVVSDFMFNFKFDLNAHAGANLGLFAGMLIWFEIYYYFTHRLIHTPWFFRQIHHRHHRSAVPTPLTAFVFSPLERLSVMDFGVLAPLIVVNRWMPMPFYAYLAFLYSLMILDLLGHSNLDVIPQSVERVWPFSTLGNARVHGLHHQNPKVNFGFATRVLDRLYGTEIGATHYHAQFQIKNR